MMNCTACARLAPMGIRCNAHRVESKSSELIRRATEAGHVLTGSRVEQALAAEKALGLTGVRIN